MLGIIAASLFLAGTDGGVAAPAVAPRPSVLVMPVQHGGTLNEATAAFLEARMVQLLARSGRFGRVTGRSELESVLDLTRQKQMLSCDDAGCMAELAGALDANLTLGLVVGRAGDRRLLTLRMVDARDVAAIAVATRSTPGDDDALLEELDAAMTALLADPRMPGTPEAARRVSPAETNVRVTWLARLAWPALIATAMQGAAGATLLGIAGVGWVAGGVMATRPGLGDAGIAVNVVAFVLAALAAVAVVGAVLTWPVAAVVDGLAFFLGGTRTTWWKAAWVPSAVMLGGTVLAGLVATVAAVPATIYILGSDLNSDSSLFVASLACVSCCASVAGIPLCVVGMLTTSVLAMSALRPRGDADVDDAEAAPP